MKVHLKNEKGHKFIFNIREGETRVCKFVYSIHKDATAVCKFALSAFTQSG